jgi:hypothetical protein
MLGPFQIWTELDPSVAHSTGNLNFLTGAGGFIANLVFGYGGVEYTQEGLLLSPSLPPNGVTDIVVRGLSFAGGALRIGSNASHVRLTRTSGPDLQVQGTLVVVAKGGRQVILPASKPIMLIQANATSNPG